MGSVWRGMQITLLFLLSLSLAGCVHLPYRIDIEQGNIVTQEMVNQLRPGMSRRQVRFILGSPLVKSPFHTERWDYFYSLKPGNGETRQRRITLFFRQDELVRIEGDIRPGVPPQERAASEKSAVN